jgi:soluble lytic murein transglycosylase-like protein
VKLRVRTLVLTVAILAGFAGTVAAEELLYYVENGEVVITNTPSRPDVKPVPGFEERVRAVRGNLPPSRFDVMIEEVARQYGVDADLVKAVAYVESALNPKAVSPKGAMGLMQLMPATAEQYGVRNPFDPYENLVAGTRHLGDLLDEFGGDLTLALAAYNAGAGAVRRYQGVPAYRETREYVRKVHSKLGRDGRHPRAAEDSEDAEAIAVRVRADGSIVYSN